MLFYRKDKLQLRKDAVARLYEKSLSNPRIKKSHDLRHRLASAIFPIASPWYHLDEITLPQAFAISGMKNQWDRDVALKTAMGLDKNVFVRGVELFVPTNLPQIKTQNAERSSQYTPV